MIVPVLIVEKSPIFILNPGAPIISKSICFAENEIF